jgi:hypothetical protein
MELEHLVAQVFGDGYWEISFSPGEVMISAPSQQAAFKFASLEPETLAKWAQQFGKVATLVKYPGGSAYRIPATMAESEGNMGQELLILDPDRPLIETYTLSMSPYLYREIGWFLEHPTQAGGIVRVADHQQVVMAYANAQKRADFTAGVGVKKAIRWKREDFWHPGDLSDFDRDWKQGLEPNNPQSWIEYKWRSFDPELGLNSEDGWIEFINRYKLLVDELGNSYHVSWNLEMSHITKPIGV